MLVLAEKQEYIVDQPASNVRTITPMCQLRTHKKDSYLLDRVI